MNYLRSQSAVSSQTSLRDKMPHAELTGAENIKAGRAIKTEAEGSRDGF